VAKKIIVHPGIILYEKYIKNQGVGNKDLAKCLDINPSSVSRLLRGHASITAEMAVKLSVVVGQEPEEWMRLQADYDLDQAKLIVKRSKLKSLMSK